MASTYDLIIKAVDQTSGPLKRIERNLANIERQAKRINLDGAIGGKSAVQAGALAGAVARIPGPLLAIGAAAGTAAVGMSQIIDATKEFQRIENSLKLISNGSQDLANKMGMLRTVAQETRTGFADTADLFTKLTLSTEQMGVSTDDVVKVTSNLSKALQLAGADGNTASAVIRQFGQAMASGEVRGDEFRSIVEGMGPALSIMARETGLTVGQLRKMSQSGELTAEVMFNMLKNSNALNESFAKMAPTIDSLETALGDSFSRAVMNIGQASGITQAYTGIIQSLTNQLNRLSLALEADDTQLASVTARLQDTQKQLALLLKMTESEKKYFPGFDQQVKEYETEIARLIKIQKELTDAQAKSSGETGKQINQFQKLMDSAEGVADKFKDVGLTELDKLTADLKLLEKAYADFVTASDNNATQKLADTQDILNRAIAETKKQIDEYNQALKDKQQREAEAAEALKRQNDPLYDLQKNYDELFDRYKKVTQASYQLENQLGKNNVASNEQRMILKALGDEAQDLAKKLGFVTENFGQLTVNDAIKDLNQIDKNLEDVNERLQAYQGLVSGKTTSLSTEEITAATVALKEQIEVLEEQRNKMLGIEDTVKDLGKVIEETFREASKTMVSELARGIVQGKNLLDSFKNAFNTLLDTILQKILESQISNALFAMTGGAFGTQTNLNPQGLFGGKIIPGFLAEGGPANVNKPYIVGEKGPELFMPKQSGQVYSTDQLSTMGAGGETNVTFQINAIDTKSGTEFLLENKNKIIGMITQAQNQRGRQGILT